MGRMVIAAGLAGLALAVAAPAMAQRAGDWALMQYRGGVYWYPGVIERVGPNGVTMRYDDGDRETRPVNQTKPYDWRVGTRVECNWKGGGTWYAGRISALDGGRIGIAYDDGDTEITTTGRCRSR